MLPADVLEHFGCLDELIQVIYQGFCRFVVLSKVDHESWTIHLGLSGPEGRWWRGAWGSTDILNIAGSKPSAKLLETFAERLAETFTQGELVVDNWSPDEGTEIKVNFSLAECPCRFDHNFRYCPPSSPLDLHPKRPCAYLS